MEKIKRFLQSKEGKDLLIIAIIILVAFISFFLGRLSKNTPNSQSLIKYANQSALALNPSNTGNLEQIKGDNNSLESLSYDGPNLKSREYFASKRGKKYYPFGCSAGKSIKEENRIYFADESSAKAKGYTLSSNCD